MTQISTVESAYTFEDAIARHIATLGSNLDVTYAAKEYSAAEFTVTNESGESFNVQICPTTGIPEGTMVGGLFIMESEAPTVEIDGVEYTLIRQW